MSATALPARAYHTKQQAPTYLTGHVMPQRGFRLGIDYISYGLGARLSLNTVLTGFLIFPFTGDVAPNISLTVGAIRLDPVFVSLEVGFTYIRLGSDTLAKLGERAGGTISTDLWTVPLQLAVSYHPMDALLVSMDMSYFASNAGATASTGLSNANGLLAGSSLQAGITAQYAFTRVVAVTLKGRMVLWTPTFPFDYTVDLDPDTDLTLRGTAALVNLSDAFQVVPGVAFSWKIFNLRLGLGYGHFMLPNLGLVTGYRGVVPDLELYFRF